MKVLNNIASGLANKALAAVYAAAVPIVLAALPGGITALEWTAIVIAVAQAVTVYVVPNYPSLPALKFAVGFVFVAAQAVADALNHVGYSHTLLTVGSALAGTFAVYQISNGVTDTTTRLGVGAEHPLPPWEGTENV